MDETITSSVESDPFYEQDLRQMERAVNYLRWQFEMVEPFLGKRILEVGGGIGNFTLRLADHGRSVASIEPNESCFRQLVEKTRGSPNIRTHRVNVESLDEALEEGDEFDSVVMMNVLEHIEDDAATLNMLKSRLAPDGRIVLLVPAGSWAYGEIDRRLGHYRRYTKGSSRRLFAGSGLNVEFIRYYNFIGIWGWWFNSRFGELNRQSDSQILLFDRIVVPLASRAERFLAPPLGQSILVVGRNSQT